MKNIISLYVVYEKLSCGGNLKFESLTFFGVSYLICDQRYVYVLLCFYVRIKLIKVFAQAFDYTLWNGYKKLISQTIVVGSSNQTLSNNTKLGTFQFEFNQYFIAQTEYLIFYLPEKGEQHLAFHIDIINLRYETRRISI